MKKSNAHYGVAKRAGIVIGVLAAWAIATRCVSIAIYKSDYDTIWGSSSQSVTYLHGNPGTFYWFIGSLLGALAVVLAGALAGGIWLLADWILRGTPEPQRPVCSDSSCKCACHKDQQYNDDTGLWAAVAVSAATTAIAINTINNS
ncbi:MAG TPA: hypothetical protein VFQ70_00165 [Candidatus Saccharimonadaceae bacterium]|nr:hypothetical protein [Candidatus Saccharimonadaceae bacterium]